MGAMVVRRASPGCDGLEVGALYSSPLGLTCRVVSLPAPNKPWALLQYARSDGRFASASNEALVDGFRLSVCNLHVLRLMRRGGD